MNLYTASIDSEDSMEGQWNDLLYIASESEELATHEAERWLQSNRPDAELLGPIEVFQYKGDRKVLGTFDPNEDD